jgi:hypothetical protein
MSGFMAERLMPSADAGALIRAIEAPAAKRAAPHRRRAVLAAVRPTVEAIDPISRSGSSPLAGPSTRALSPKGTQGMELALGL